MEMSQKGMPAALHCMRFQVSGCVALHCMRLHTICLVSSALVATGLLLRAQAMSYATKSESQCPSEPGQYAVRCTV